MKYEVRPQKESCYVDGCRREIFELSFEDTEESTADVFSVYEREADGCLRWIADFGDRAEAEKWKKAAEVEITTSTKRTIRFSLGSIELYEESGTVNFGTISSTADYAKVRELSKVLEDVAVMMESYGGQDGTIK
jgi:hypothetical protein